MVLVGPSTDEDTRRVLTGPEAQAMMAAAGATLRVCAASADSPEFVAALREADALVVADRLPTDVVREARGRLRMVSVTATGVHAYVDPAALGDLGLAVANVPAYADAAIAEHALALLLAAAKNLVPSHLAVVEGGWPERPSTQLAGRTAGVVGLGGIGLRTVRLLEALSMRVLVWTRNPDPVRLEGTSASFVPLPELFAEADVVSLHLGLTPETVGIVDEALLASVRPGLILVNTARAELMAPGALERHVRSGRIRAGLDVFPEEPRVSADLRSLPGVVLSPHAAFRTEEGLRALLLGALGNALEFLAGRPRKLL